MKVAAQIRFTHCLTCSTRLCLERYRLGVPLCKTCQDKDDAVETNRLRALDEAIDGAREQA